MPKNLLHNWKELIKEIVPRKEGDGCHFMISLAFGRVIISSDSFADLPFLSSEMCVL